MGLERLHTAGIQSEAAQVRCTDDNVQILMLVCRNSHLRAPIYRAGVHPHADGFGKWTCALRQKRQAGAANCIRSYIWGPQACIQGTRTTTQPTSCTVFMPDGILAGVVKKHAQNRKRTRGEKSHGQMLLQAASGHVSACPGKRRDETGAYVMKT